MGGAVALRVDPVRRAATMRNHTATHVLHRAIRIVAGADAKQRGSLVDPGSLRFDYPLDRALPREERDAVEAEVRRAIREDMPVVAAEMSIRPDGTYSGEMKTVPPTGEAHWRAIGDAAVEVAP